MSKKVKWLKRRKQTLLDIIEELLSSKVYTVTALAKELWTYRQRLNSIRNGTARVMPDEVEKLLKKLGQ